ncbi:hypothetical protein KSP40_PGU014971 [Platanthera guangdongensis]|uniref:Uncharacterized protein n=1 Tax=Platanthera guangdongensis TaxID=2320717 RepID=A0ABR2LPR0_9ASPA
METGSARVLRESASCPSGEFPLRRSIPQGSFGGGPKVERTNKSQPKSGTKRCSTPQTKTRWPPRSIPQGSFGGGPKVGRTNKSQPKSGTKRCSTPQTKTRWPPRLKPHQPLPNPYTNAPAMVNTAKPYQMSFMKLSPTLTSRTSYDRRVKITSATSAIKSVFGQEQQRDDLCFTTVCFSL